jgi:hypothetical protein
MAINELLVELIFRDLNRKKSNNDKSYDARQQLVECAKTREYIKLYFGEFNAQCRNNKYLILQSIMKRMVFEE